MGTREDDAAMKRLRQRILEALLARKGKVRFTERLCAGVYLLFGVCSFMLSYIIVIDPSWYESSFTFEGKIPLLELLLVIGPLLLGVESFRAVMGYNHRKGKIPWPR